MGDLNPRPLACHASALPAELIPLGVISTPNQSTNRGRELNLFSVKRQFSFVCGERIRELEARQAMPLAHRSLIFFLPVRLDNGMGNLRPLQP